MHLQVEQKEAVPTEQANTKLADLTDMGTVQVGSNQASCRSPQGALSSSGGSACPSVQHLQDAAQLQERSQREAQHGVRLQQQQADDVQWQQCQQEAMQSSTKQQSGHSGYRDASFATRAALCDEHSTSQISIGHVAGHAQAADEHADSALTIPDSVPDEPAELHQTEPVSMPMQPQQLPTSNSMPAEVAAVSHDCTSPLHTSIQISATVAISDSGSETDVSAVPDSQELVDMHTLLMPEAQQTRNDATDDEDTVASPSGLHSSADSNFCILSEPVLIGAALSPAADTTQSAQQTAGAALKRSSATSPHRQPTVAANHTSQMSMPSTMEQHRSPLPKPEPVPHQQMLPQSVCSSSRCSPSTTCAASSLIIEDSDSDGDFQTAQPSRPITGKSSGPLQPATVSQRNPTMSKASTSNCSRLQQAAADSQSGQRQAGRQGVHALKLMLRGPRGTTVKQVHALASLKGVEFAELLQVGQCCTALPSHAYHTWSVTVPHVAM